MSVILTDAARTGGFERLPKVSRKVQPTFSTIFPVNCPVAINFNASS
jgi:hypothetical protein